MRNGRAGGYGSNQHTKKELDPNNLSQATQGQLSEQIGITTQQLANYKKLTTLIPDLQELIETGELKATTGYKIWAKMPQDEQGNTKLNGGNTYE